MAIYGITVYGTDYYGYDFPPAYRVDPFIAASLNYSSVLVTWNAPANPAPTNPNNPVGNPTGTIVAYRLVKNKFGFPVDQDDGEILIDSFSFPGKQFIDTDVVPGTYQYYGFFLLIDFLSDTWVRSGWTSCLAINNYDTGRQISSLIPTFYDGQSEPLTDVLSPDFPTTFQDFFCEVLGWGLDYLKTQYDTYLNVNNPWTIPVKDLYNLGTQLGININPDIHPYTLRKAIYFNAEVTKNRGTTAGIVQELDVLTGWSADLQIAENFMLNNDQSAFLDPVFLPWSANLAYNIGEYVAYSNFWYQCAATGNLGHAPSGTNTNNTYWNVIQGVDNSTFLANPATTQIGTWELIYPTVANGVPAASSFFEELGVANPLNTTSFQFNSLKVYNKSGTNGTTVWTRSLCRVPADFTPVTTTFAPNKDQVVGDGIPVPFTTPSLIWNGTTWNNHTRFGTTNIVDYYFQPFVALTASTNVTPPYNTRAGMNNQWAPVSMDQRFRICASAYMTSSTTGVTATPFVEWYDAGGNFITRILARNSGTSPGVPGNFAYDSFTNVAGTTLAGRTTDDGIWPWSQVTGTFNVASFDQGCAYPANQTVRTYATLNVGTANCQLGVTFVTAPNTLFTPGIVFRWVDDTHYFIASQTGISNNSGGTFTNIGTYSQAANIGDRLVVQLNGSTITAFVNNVQVLSVSSAVNQSSTIHGIIYDNVSATGSGGSVTVTNPGAQNSVVGTAI